MIQVTSVADVFHQSAARYAGRPLIVDVEKGRHLSQSDLEKKSNQAACLFQQMGLKPGDTVSFFLKNSPDFFVPWVGGIKAGLVVNPINLGLERNIERVVYMLTKARAKAFVIEDDFLSTARAVREQLPELPFLNVSSNTLSSLDYETELARQGEDYARPAIQPHHPFQMIFTSGTTGLPKAVVQRHEMLCDSFALREHFKMCEGQVYACVLPLFHVNAQYTSFFPALTLGNPVCLFEKFSASRFFPVVKEHGVNVVSVVPSLLTRLLAHGIPPQEDYAGLDYIICGAAPLSVDLQKEFMEKTGLFVSNGWGMTETGCWGCQNDPSQPEKMKPGSMGKPLAINEMKVVDRETGQTLPAGRTGGLFIKGPNVFDEYFDAEEATRKSFPYGDGFFDTGDDVMADEDGVYFFVGRGSVDTGKVDGEFVNYLSIDEKLWQHPAVLEACCVGVPDDIRGNVVAACVKLKDRQQAAPDDIIGFLKDRVMKFEVPRFVLFVEDIPKGDTGKIQRKVMTEQAIALLQEKR